MKKNRRIEDDSPLNEKIKKRNGIQVIARAAAILRTLRDAPEGLSLSQIAKQIELPRSTVQRIVESLDHENLVISASLSKGVRLGPALISLAAATRFEITEIARNTIQQIARDSREAVALSLCSGSKIIFVDQVASTYDLRVDVPIGHSLPMHSTAPGKAVMAAMDEDALEKLQARLNLIKFTTNTITTWSAMEKELERVRKSGVAFDIEETSLGISSIGVALTLRHGEFAAISIPIPMQRFEEQKSKLIEVLIKHSEKLQRRLSKERR
jgi:DNA-binding IclR family transcriptional regulator